MTAAFDLTGATIESVGAAIHARDVSPTEVIEATLDRIEALNGVLNACTTVTADYARMRAREAERELSTRGPRGPLHGIPYCLKDVIDTAGIRTTYGYRSHADHIPKRNATVHERLESAGAILVGKSTSHIRRSVPVECVNPWDVSRSPGISSSGSGAALATSMCLASVATDTGGSVRIPAAWCGVVGLKPTPGLVSRFGAFPASWSYDVAGPMARTVRDAALVLEAISGYDANDPTTLPTPASDFLAVCDSGIAEMRIGLLASFLEPPCDPAVRRSIEAAVSVLRDLGAVVEEVTLEDAERALRALAATVPECAVYYSESFSDVQLSQLDDDVKVYLERARTVTMSSYLAALREGAAVRQEMLALLNKVDIVAAPTTMDLPWARGDTASAVQVLDDQSGSRQRTLIGVTSIASIAGLPALSVPCGFSDDGWPIGLHLMARPFAESAILRVGLAYESATDWALRVPPVLADENG